MGLTCLPLWLSLSGEIPSQAEVDASGGIGLIRSEYVQRSISLTEILTQRVGLGIEEYLASICEVAFPKEVWYRTTDFCMEEANGLPGSSIFGFERNPLLGVRGVKRSLIAHEEWRVETCAVTRVSKSFTNFNILLPFVSHEREFTIAAEHLKEEGFSGGIGCMVEIPSLAMRVRELVSAGASRLLVGVQDLASLTLGAQRSQEAIHHPTVWRLIARTMSAAAEAGIQCGIAGGLELQNLAREVHSDYLVSPLCMVGKLMGLSYSNTWAFEDDVKHAAQMAIAGRIAASYGRRYSGDSFGSSETR